MSSLPMGFDSWAQYYAAIEADEQAARDAAPSPDEFETAGNTFEYNGKTYTIEQNTSCGYVSVTDEEGNDVFYTQGDDADELLDMGYPELMDYLDSAGVLN